jgi:DNA-directed RNA polymerase specialized sigma24 family protein
MIEGLLVSSAEVTRCLLTYSDWWQPATASVFPVGSARRSGRASDGLHPGLLETLDERTELCRRMSTLAERDRRLLFLWYVSQLEAGEIARALRISRRQLFRLRARAIRKIVDAGDPPAQQ